MLDDLLSASGNENLDLDSDITGFVNTGSYILNALLSGSIYGGVPSNKIIALAGESSTGKTFYATSICKHFLDSNERGAVLYFDSESAVTKSLLESRCIDPTRFKVLPVSTVEEFRSQACKILDKYLEKPEEKRMPLMMVLDSVGMLSTNKELSDIEEGKDVVDFTKPKKLKGAFRVLTMKLSYANVPLIVTNHTYTTVGMFPSQEMAGGSGLKYAASIVVALSKKQEKDSGNKETVGNIIKAKLLKSRITKENKIVETRLFYDDRGLDHYYGLLQLAEKYGVIAKSGNRYEIDGKKVYEKNILENPDTYFTSDFMEKLEICASQEFNYG